MEQAHCPTSENLQLGRLVADAVVEIERLGYSRRSRNRYRAIWEHLIEDEARKHLEKARKMAPSNPDIQYMMGMLDYPVKDMPAARKQLNQC